MKNLPIVSIIILNYNGLENLNDCFKSLESLNYPRDKYEIIMVDGNSKDDSVHYVKKTFPKVKLLELDKNYGFTIGNNKGAKIAKGKYLIFLNNDTFVDKDWLKEFIEAVTMDKEVISAGCKMLKTFKREGKEIIDYAGGKFTYDLNFYVGIDDYDSPKYSKKQYTAYGCGAALLIDKEFFFEIGGFDEYYFGGGEEVEVGLRSWERGYKVLYVPKAIIYHKRRGSFKKINYFATSIWTKSIFYFILKNYNLRYISFYMLESLFFVHLAKIIFFIIKRDVRGVYAVLRGIYWFFKDLLMKNVSRRLIVQRRFIKNHIIENSAYLKKANLISSFGERLMYRIKLGRYFT